MKKILLAAAFAVVAVPAFAAPEAFTIDLGNNYAVSQGMVSQQMQTSQSRQAWKASARQQQMQPSSQQSASEQGQASMEQVSTDPTISRLRAPLRS